MHHPVALLVNPHEAKFQLTQKTRSAPVWNRYDCQDKVKRVSQA